MTYWLCDKRKHQQSAPVMRFDPRFWTLNFPRPMMASVVTTGPESLRVEATFYRSDDLAGLIWESEDIWDHPLLAYETNRDYSHLTLTFRWRSQGIMPLDAVNGPTLTIEGRDADGQPKSWFVRLWNYASGTAEDAQIVLPFSQIAGGFMLPDEADPIVPDAIDRMFISIVPPQYSGGPGDFASAVEGWVEMSEIRCDGQGVMLDTGNVMLPEHSLQMATGYDDSYNQTPARLLRQIEALGYRGTINHYVGMSHYFRLEPLSGGHYVSLTGGALNAPCSAWHLDFATRAKAIGYDLIVSLSYELFDAHCWNDWKQRAENGDPALTGWSPPSALLSPANMGAMGYLQAVGRAFAYILKLAGLPVKFQVGEPWWWIMADGRVCLYDAAATVAIGALSVSIPDISGPKTSAQNAMLDRAGEILAASTAALVTAVADEAGAVPFTSHILVYLPTVLDEAAPEARRANVPLGWAAPAFDVLQLEDYDWVTAGNAGATERGVAAATARLGYPVSEQHYFAGFVLRPEDRAQWQSIEASCRQSKARGTDQTFVWALPQVTRDGFTYFELDKDQEDDVRAFDDVTFPLEIGRKAAVNAEFSTQIISLLSGREKRNSGWSDAKLSYDVAPGICSEADVAELLAFFRARRGPAVGFRFADPLDYSSNGMTGQPTANDQMIGTGDGVRTDFALVKQYGAVPDLQQRHITHPRNGSVLVGVDGIAATGWTLEPSGLVRFENPPAAGAVITAGFLFDVPVRFANDRLELNGATFGAGEIDSVILVEVRDQP
ncbi:MAG: DUF2460 domain-containing protein [Sphingomonadales bacterium]|jgi:uncharacterized protein (TIGR02217 family)|uniref:DUF2460 domain-containing protein n=3 Tax=Sphingorhabdus sp. TaxID=1902408 RepID=UPI003BB0610D|nr:DUF2460 domain-containing protein [Sphingomonadales bacterium]MBK9432590.1 DUF2460 domain-containing protein [Sphingomonadales bacterium]